MWSVFGEWDFRRCRTVDGDPAERIAGSLFVALVLMPFVAVCYVVGMLVYLPFLPFLLVKTLRSRSEANPKTRGKATMKTMKRKVFHVEYLDGYIGKIISQEVLPDGTKRVTTDSGINVYTYTLHPNGTVVMEWDDSGTQSKWNDDL